MSQRGNRDYKNCTAAAFRGGVLAVAYSPWGMHVRTTRGSFCTAHNEPILRELLARGGRSQGFFKTGGEAATAIDDHQFDFESEPDENAHQLYLARIANCRKDRDCQRFKRIRRMRNPYAH